MKLTRLSCTSGSHADFWNAWRTFSCSAGTRVSPSQISSQSRTKWFKNLALKLTPNLEERNLINMWKKITSLTGILPQLWISNKLKQLSLTCGIHLDTFVKEIPIFYWIIFCCQVLQSLFLWKMWPAAFGKRASDNSAAKFRTCHNLWDLKGTFITW